MIYHTSNYIEIEITKEMIELARKRADDIGKLKNSVSDGRNVIYGTLFEIMIQKFTGCEYIGDYNYDLIYKGKRLEAKVKPCKKCQQLTMHVPFTHLMINRILIGMYLEGF